MAPQGLNARTHTDNVVGCGFKFGLDEIQKMFGRHRSRQVNMVVDFCDVVQVSGIVRDGAALQTRVQTFVHGELAFEDLQSFVGDLHKSTSVARDPTSERFPGQQVI